MSNYAKTTIIGNLAADPQLFNNDSSKSAMCVGRVGVDESWNKRDANGNTIIDPQTNKPQQDKITTWYDFQIYGKRAEAFAKYHKKGDRCLLEGQMRLGKQYLSKKPQPIYLADGQPQADANGQHFHGHIVRQSMFLRVEDWKFMKSKRDDNTAYAGTPAGVPAAGVVAPAAGVAAPQTQPVASANPQTVAAAFTGQTATTPAPVDDGSAPTFVMPSSSFPQGV